MEPMSGTILIPEFSLNNGCIAMRWDGAVNRCSDTSTVSVLAAGDWADCRCYADASSRDPQQLYDGVYQDIQDADVAVVNFECAGDEGTPVIKEGPVLTGTAAAFHALKQAGFDVACLANNHALDCGVSGLQETLRLAAGAGVSCFGAGHNAAAAFKPVILHAGGLRIGLLGVAEPEDGEPDPDHSGIASAFNVYVLDHVRALKASCDVAVVIVHGGREYVPVPSLYWYDRVMAIAGAGADTVIGHHPHVPQGATVLRTVDGRDVPVFFSTGNFLFRPALSIPNQIPPHTADGYMVKLGFAKEGAPTVDLIPYGIQGRDGVKRVQGDACQEFVHLISCLSDELCRRDHVAAWFDAVVDFQWMLHYRNRFETFTRKLLEGDTNAIRFVRNHHHSPAHMTLIDRALQRVQAGTVGTADAKIQQKLSDWYSGRWPCGAFGRQIGD